MREEETEIWAYVPEHPNYLVSSYGQVYSAVRRIMLTPRDNGRGYLKVALSDRWGDVTEHYIHHLVGLAFLLEYEAGVMVKHVDENRYNNHVANLVVVKRGLRRNPLRKIDHLFGHEVKILESGDVFQNVYAAAEYIQGDASNIYKCLRGERKSHKGYTFVYYP